MAPVRFRWNLGRFRSGPVPVDFAGTRPVPRFFSDRVLNFKVAKKTVENIYSLKSENLAMFLFVKYNLRFLNFRY